MQFMFLYWIIYHQDGFAICIERKEKKIMKRQKTKSRFWPVWNLNNGRSFIIPECTCICLCFLLTHGQCEIWIMGGVLLFQSAHTLFFASYLPMVFASLHFIGIGFWWKNTLSSKQLDKRCLSNLFTIINIIHLSKAAQHMFYQRLMLHTW